MRASLFVAMLALGCSSTTPAGPGDASTTDGANTTDTSAPDASDASNANDASDAGTSADSGDALAKLLAMTASCDQVSNDLYALNAGDTPTVPICALGDAGTLYWQADMDVDCDGKQTTQCSLQTDPDFQNQTAATDSQGNPLDAANLPYVVVPGKSTRFDFGGAGLKLGDVIAVVYQNQIEYAVYGDVGPSADIGEASYATVAALGADPNPKTGGVDGADVLYVAFPGALVTPIEDHAQAVSVGQAALAKLVGP
jgi:hypothetical protein